MSRQDSSRQDSAKRFLSGFVSKNQLRRIENAVWHPVTPLIIAALTLALDLYFYTLEEWLFMVALLLLLAVGTYVLTKKVLIEAVFLFLGGGLDFFLSVLSYDWLMMSFDLAIIGSTMLVLIDQYYYKSG